jgi:ribosomal protein L11 methyltransferase
MKNFKNVSISISEEKFDLAIAVLTDYPILGIQEETDKLTATFLDSEWTSEMRMELLQSLKNIDKNAQILSEELLNTQNWNEEFERNIPIINISNRIAIMPEWKKFEVSVDIPIIINPKMSFGTGQHETTRLIAKLMEKYVQPGQFWIDAGTGTGVLAILALKLGAARAFAFDNNEWSIENATENFDLNDVSDSIDLIEADIENITLPKSDGIVANLYANLVRNSFPKFYNSLVGKNGVLLVSGILIYDIEEVIQSAVENNFELIEQIQESEWVSLAFKCK